MITHTTTDPIIPSLDDTIVAALRTVYDPEIPINIYDLGLIYGVVVDAEKVATITMTLTSPNCPEAQTLPAKAADAVRAIPEIDRVEISLVWDPPWSQERVAPDVRALLGWG